MTLPASISDLQKALARTRDFASQAANDVNTYIKLAKQGEWTLGSDEIEVEPGSRWAVNPNSFATGFSAFNENTRSRVGEEMRNMMEPPITMAELPTVDGIWNAQIGFAVKCLDGEDEGTEALVYSRSKGGLKAAKDLLEAVLTKADEGSTDCVPVINFEVDAYKHKAYGKIFTPIFAVQDWISLDGEPSEPEALPEPEPEPEVKPTRRTRRARK